MLSYRHAYHAGNFADVMKHVVLTSVLKYMARKDGALCYIDTHAGAGGYDLSSVRSRKTDESSFGISKLWNLKDAPESISDYLDLVRRYNPSGNLVRYPGSPWLASKLLRPKDRLVLCELHTSDFPALDEMFTHDRRVHCHAEDGYRFSKGLVPPLERRGLVLMDPSYELRDEYETAISTVGALHRQFSNGTYALWYPILDERRTTSLRRRIDEMKIRDVLHLELRVTDRKSLPGMYGCGMIVVNPPWTLRGAMESALPCLVSELGMNRMAAFQIEQWMAE
ncbi:MAG: 23S rRNA (adenine(2030)-N(6))-methyltransferase RlmJ [Proteobacteria bacterium]|nr:23S rRNA (adenine(2030)-N(6))-methyltransferase RlmJ [Pseudomonadota bacterium]